MTDSIKLNYEDINDAIRKLNTFGSRLQERKDSMDDKLQGLYRTKAWRGDDFDAYQQAWNKISLETNYNGLACFEHAISNYRMKLEQAKKLYEDAQGFAWKKAEYL